jgi:hypothetical protein
MRFDEIFNIKTAILNKIQISSKKIRLNSTVICNRIRPVLKPAIIKYVYLLLALTALCFWHSAVLARTEVLENDDTVVVYEPPLNGAARDVLRNFPHLRQELKENLGWRLNVRPRIVLIKANQTFQKISRNDLIVAFAVPDKNLIVIDYSRMATRPYNLNITLKHEMCHLLLHEHIPNDNLPKWLDEGVCQWVSDGIGEIFIDKGWSGLDAAVMANQTFRLSKLANRFPGQKAGLMLAYEQSKSIVFYIDRQYGKKTILAILNDLRNGESIEAAVAQNMDLDLYQLEEEWLGHLESTPRWLVFLANNIYAIIFFLAAVLSIFGFIRIIIKKRGYSEIDDDEEED